MAKNKASPPSPGERAHEILETRRPTFKKTSNPSLIKRTPEKKLPSPPRPGAPQNSPTTPANPPTTGKRSVPNYPTPKINIVTTERPQPQRQPRRLEVDVSSSAASRDSSVASIDSEPKDVKNRVQKAKSPATHPPAFATTSGLRGRKRAQEDEPEPEFKQPATIPKYSSQITPPQPSTSYAQATVAGGNFPTTHNIRDKNEEMDTAPQPPSLSQPLIPPPLSPGLEEEKEGGQRNQRHNVQKTMRPHNQAPK
ncbi:hypothetical protein ACJJTC_013079 [Scirpophaga incertulas]